MYKVTVRFPSALKCKILGLYVEFANVHMTSFILSVLYSFTLDIIFSELKIEITQRYDWKNIITSMETVPLDL